MATLSAKDQTLSLSDQKKILAAKEAYAKATTQAERDQANADAEAVRIANGYYGGASGNGFTAIEESSSASKPFASHPTGYTNVVDRTDVSSLSADDRAKLSLDDQKAIAKLKTAYAKATDQGTKDYINGIANTIRSKANYSMGRDGNSYSALAYGQGGRSADQLRQELEAFQQDWYDPVWGWRNGYSVAMNNRSDANMIRQQMHANELAMNDSNREMLQKENEALAQLLYDYTGQSKKTTYYNEETGRWETWNPDIGYGYDMTGTLPDVRNNWKNYYGYTEEEIENWAKDKSHYYNFVDPTVAARNTVDERSGYTGKYAQFVNGPYLISGTKNQADHSMYEDVYGDGFGMEDILVTPQYDENGNVIKQAPALKYNNNMPETTARHAPIAASGVLSGRGASTPLITDADPYNSAGQRAYYENYGKYSDLRVPTSSGTAGGYAGYLQQIYADALEAQLKALESGHIQNLSELDASQKEVDALYKEQKRQVSGQSAQNSAAWREVANAYGLGSGAVGQASLAQRNQLQSDLNKLNAAQASARTEIQRQRLLLGQQYQLAIEQAVAENNGALAKSLYEEAVRAEESLKQEEQFYANLALQYGKSMMSFAKSAGSGLSRVDEYNIIEDAVKDGFISDAQAMHLAQMFGFV